MVAAVKAVQAYILTGYKNGEMKSPRMGFCTRS